MNVFPARAVDYWFFFCFLWTLLFDLRRPYTHTHTIALRKSLIQIWPEKQLHLHVT